MYQKKPFILIASIASGALISLVSLSGILIKDIYHKETANWQAQSFGQDIVDLFLIVPCLLITSVFAYKGSKIALLLWGGVLCYLVYTFIIYTFGVHFNRLFIVYCFTLGLSFYNLIYFFMQWKQGVKIKSVSLTNTVAIYFFIISLGFYFLWLSEIIPATIKNTIPQSIIDVGLPNNPVHVLDLSVFLPALVITSILLFKKRPLGFILAPVFLVFMILMDVTIASLQIVMITSGVASGFILPAIMLLFAVFSSVLLFYYCKNILTISHEK